MGLAAIAVFAVIGVYLYMLWVMNPRHPERYERFTKRFSRLNSDEPYTGVEDEDSRVAAGRRIEDQAGLSRSHSSKD